MDLILEHFLKCLLKYFLTNFESPPDSLTPGNVFLNRQSVLSCALILKLNAISRKPEFAYINAPPASYKGIATCAESTESAGNPKATLD